MRRGRRRGSRTRRASFVELPDDPRQLVGGGAHRRDRAAVVHPHRADDADGAEMTRWWSVTARHDREGLQLSALVLLPDPEEHPRLIERVLEYREKRDAVLEHQHQVAELRELLYAVLGQQARGAVDVERVA